MSYTLRLLLTATLLTSAAHAEHTLWYQQAAKNWNEALPVGNGRMGAMIFGNPSKERIQLNEDSMWAGQKKDVKLVIGTPKDLADIRQLIDNNQLAQANGQIMGRFSRLGVVRSHQTLGELYIDWKKTDTPVSDYRRQLDLKTALSTTTWKRGSTTYTQEVFCSNPDEALIIKLTADGPDTLNFNIRLDRPKDKGTPTHTTKSVKNNGVQSLLMQGQITQKDGKLQSKPVPTMKGCHFTARLDASSDQGSITAEENQLKVSGAKSVVLRLVARTDFFTPGKPITLSPPKPSLVADFDQLLKCHIADHQSLYNRCELALPADSELAKLPTDKRFARLSKTHTDLGLESLIFHYGRYLLIASSRSNGSPANLQGLWNPHIKAPWNCDYHLNINLQMNYWPDDVTNLSETTKPLFTWMQRLGRNGKITASKQYGMRGWMSHHASELYAQTPMKSGLAMWGGWIHGGGWMCQHLWTSYTFTQDQQFLKEIAYPLLAGQSRFYLDWLVKKDGKLISSPESSPENTFKTPDGKSSAVCAKAAMGQQIITEVLTNTLAAAKVLGINSPLIKEIKTALPQVDSGQHIGPDGRLLEWDKPYQETQPGHRHLSHLYGFHPGDSITLENTPKLFEAAKKSIEFRAQHNSVGIGWSRAWALSIYARLRDGETAHYHLHEMLRTQTLINGFNSVFGKNRPVFQIEANLGATAGIAEMLLQSHGGTLHLLPALPKAWASGEIKGLKARGGHSIDLTWKEGELTHATITKGAEDIPNIYIQGKLIKDDPRVKILKGK